jgi:hypothetical protein
MDLARTNDLWVVAQCSAFYGQFFKTMTSTAHCFGAESMNIAPLDDSASRQDQLTPPET